ncbi:hypothetical protein A0J57_18620 [Sphingobium sp. 22B]|uniref:LysR family transcriptional regulator n=1 Tax=unclassified Sphingobium TaxID=2611147 RepID=UPI0007846689|nr:MULTISPECIES: LysR family transcriptional regulator [unclassified Sphingobium]KXU29426.1 hypothetical protein AXW74_23055 [Sphingobium sp. AM]KYC30853.1 hypothetical protein A0J57_18620 [Sphingobium sp. 22B]OAP29386.1 hypothetical protein A8O16_23920 [Sphingobium sp. 20006FA]
MININDLSLFHSIVQHGGLTAAAQQTGVPKSLLSKRLARLEADLGVRLIERSSRRFRVTEIGEAIYRQSETVVAGVEASVALAAKAQMAPHGTIRTACPPGIAQYMVAGLLPRFMQLYPQIRIRMMITNRRIDLIEEQVDVAFRVRDRLDSDTSLTMRMLGHSKRVIVAAPALVPDPAAITFQHIGEMPAISMTETVERDRWRLLGPDGEEQLLTVQPRLGCSDFSVLMEATLAGTGVALLPEEIVDDALADGRLVRLMPGWHSMDGLVHMVFTGRRGLLPATRAFIDFFAEAGVRDKGR